MLCPQEDDLHTHELKSLIPATINTGIVDSYYEEQGRNYKACYLGES